MGAEEWRHFSGTEEGDTLSTGPRSTGGGGMNWTMRLSTLALSASMLLGAGVSSHAQQTNMSFFVTSIGSGKGADLGGIQGADQHCQQLARLPAPETGHGMPI
jgi:hypothetical protein